WWRQPPVVVLVPIPGPQNRFRSDPIARCGVDLTLPLPPPAWGAHLPGRGGLGPLARPSLRGGALRARGRPGPVDDVPEQRRDVGAPVRADAWQPTRGSSPPREAGIGLQGPLERVPGHQLGLPRPGRGPRRGPGARALRSVAAVVGAVRGDAGRRRRRGPGPGGGRAARVVLHAAHGFQLLRHSALPQALPRRVRGPPCGDARPARRRPRPAPLPRRGRAALAGGAAEAMAAVPPGDEVAHGRRVVGCIRGRVPGGAGARGLQHRVRRRRSQRAGGSGRPGHSCVWPTSSSSIDRRRGRGR
ncbi:unnamed protein product, partial [Prorocentrum cordatum]